MRSKEPRELLNLARSLFESNEDLKLFLIGGLAAQNIYASMEVRKTSGIDILTTREDAERLVGRMRNNGYGTFYNPDLGEYSVFKHDEGIHIDIYQGGIGGY